MKRVLLVSYLPPSTEHAGGQRLLDLYGELKKIQPQLHLTLVTCGDQSYDLALLKDIFDEVHCIAPSQFSKRGLSALNLGSPGFSLIDVQYHQAGALIGALRALWPSATLIFSPMESQLRAAKIALTQGKRRLWRTWRNTLGLALNASMEIVYALKADKVVTVSDSDRDALALLKQAGKVICLPTCMSPQNTLPIAAPEPSKGNETIVFFAYFGSRTNQEALYWFVQKVHPAICQALPNYRFRLVGHGISESVLENCAVEQIDVVGPVSTITEALSGAAIGISPALSGAGVRGKIHQYAAFGLPCVASPIACEGLSYKDGESIFIAGNADDFSEACITLLQDEKRREQAKEKAMAVCSAHYQWSAWRPEIASTYELNI